jgi:hypothetical protein
MFYCQGGLLVIYLERQILSLAVVGNLVETIQTIADINQRTEVWCQQSDRQGVI